MRYWNAPLMAGCRSQKGPLLALSRIAGSKAFNLAAALQGWACAESVVCLEAESRFFGQLHGISWRTRPTQFSTRGKFRWKSFAGVTNFNQDLTLGRTKSLTLSRTTPSGGTAGEPALGNGFRRQIFHCCSSGDVQVFFFPSGGYPRTAYGLSCCHFLPPCLFGLFCSKLRMALTPTTHRPDYWDLRPTALSFPLPRSRSPAHSRVMECCPG